MYQAVSQKTYSCSPCNTTYYHTILFIIIVHMFKQFFRPTWKDGKNYGKSVFAHASYFIFDIYTVLVIQYIANAVQDGNIKKIKMGSNNLHDYSLLSLYMEATY